jgi:hypothetical protein
MKEGRKRNKSNKESRNRDEREVDKEGTTNSPKTTKCDACIQETPEPTSFHPLHGAFWVVSFIALGWSR